MLQVTVCEAEVLINRYHLAVCSFDGGLVCHFIVPYHSAFHPYIPESPYGIGISSKKLSKWLEM